MQMSEERSRHLAAVWCADIAGYITLSGRDEEAAQAIVGELQRLARETVEAHGGLVVKFIGDAALAAFDSTEVAIRSAFALQSAFQSSALVRQHGSGLRIGVHVGEIVQTEDGDLHGDGVNIASRIQAVAETGGVVASESAARQVENRDDFDLHSMGSREFKGVRRPLAVYAIQLKSATPGEESADVREMSVLAEALADRYRIGGELGRGGMATVYRAHDIRHDRPVALKVMHQELTDAVGAERFLREIRVTANLQHPHVLPLFDSGEVGGRLFYVMPLVEGERLRDRIRREIQLGITETIKVVRDVASALMHAHESGVVHRDIKPENIMFSGDYAVLTDFGVARAVTQSSDEGLTHRGLAMGSPPYMAPEQMKDSGSVDGRTDVYALGCVMYEMLVGSPPFTGSTAQVIMARHATDPPSPIRSVRQNVPEALEAVVMRCLAKTPADRFAGAGDLVAALDDVMRSHAASPAATPPVGSAGVPASAPPYPTPSAGLHATAGSNFEVPTGEQGSFLGELKRRNVYQTAVIYLLAAGGAVQFADMAFPTFGLEAYFDFVVMGALLGFPLVIVLAWAYDITTMGVRRATPYGGGTLAAQLSATAGHRYGVRLRVMGFVGLLLFLGLLPLHRTVTIPEVDSTKAGARRVAEDLIAEVGFGGAFDEVSTFEIYELTNAFMQETVGRDWTQGSIGEFVSLWEWRFRWYRPGEPEEWLVDVGPGSRVTSFNHVIPRIEAGAKLTEDEARLIAEEFLATQNLTASELISEGASSNTFENRTRYTFNWRAPELDLEWVSPAGEAEQGVGHVHVQVDGDEISRYQIHLLTPQGFGRIRSARSAVFSVLAGLVYFGVLTMSIVLLVSTARKKQAVLPWKRAGLAGVWVAVLGGMTIAPVMWNGQVLSFSTALPWIATVGLVAILSILLGVAIGGVVVVLIAMADPIARRYYPLMLQSWDKVCSREWRAPVLSGDVIHGVSLGGILLGVEGLRLLTISSVPVVVGIRVPEIMQLVGAPVATFTIVGMFLMDAVTGQLGLLAALVILRRYLKSSAVAIAVIMIIGGFTTDIPVEPVYVSAAFAAASFGVVGMGLVRWGLITAMVAVFTAEAIGGGIKLALSGNSVFATQGAIVIVAGLLPLVFALLARARDDDVGAPAPI